MTSIEDSIVEKQTPHYTSRRPILCGSFNISRATIPFFQAVLTLEDVAKELSLVEKLPADLRSKWRLEELFQREIDWDRVEHEIVDGYLRRPEKLQFFNALTVALLPLKENRMLASTYAAVPNPPDVPPNYAKEPWTLNNVGGVQLLKATGSQHGFLSWDPKRVFAATIDGQHRLAALQRLFQRGNLPAQVLETSISVIFLVLDESAGFKIADTLRSDDENPILTVVREVFIDLNKSARAVVAARRILLDDQEIEARCVRQLLAPRVGEIVEGRLPLGIVHWQHAVTAKFNSGEQTGPFVTTVELLHLITRDILEIKIPNDPLDDGEIRRFVRSVEEALGPSDVIAKNPAKYPGLPALEAYVERHHLKEGFEQPFANLPAQYLRACDEGFNERWREALVTVLTKFKPYRTFIEAVKKRGGVEGDLAFYMCLPRSAQEAQVKEWGELRYEKIDTPLKELARLKVEDWPFYAVFQKGLLRATAKALVAEGATTPEARTEFLKKWIAFLDWLSDAGHFAVRAKLASDNDGFLWAGIALNPGSKTVKWSNAAVVRIAAVLLLWWYYRSSAGKRIATFVKNIDDGKSNEKFPDARLALDKLRSGLKAVVPVSPDDTDPDAVSKLVEVRLRTVIDLAQDEKAERDDKSHDASDDKGKRSETDEGKNEKEKR